MQGSLWRQRVGSERGAPAHRRAGLRLPARLVARRAPHRLRLVPRRRDRASPARPRHRRVDAAPRRTARCNLEPRWSPDGRRLAFTSTLYEGRWHVFTADVTPDGRAERVERITEDQESGLPRYYYNTVDHVPLADLVAGRARADRGLEPRPHLGLRWLLADGRRARAAAAREIRDEETTWKARPDWSRDGRRVVYSSYLGRPVEPALADDAPTGRIRCSSPTATFDATAPRWSPDGRHDRLRLERGRQHVALDRRGAGRHADRGPGRSGESIARRWDGSGSGDGRRGPRCRPGVGHRARRPKLRARRRLAPRRRRLRPRASAGSSTAISTRRAATRSPCRPGEYAVEVTRGPSTGSSAGRSPIRAGRDTRASRLARAARRPRGAAAGTAPTSTCT